MAKGSWAGANPVQSVLGQLEPQVEEFLQGARPGVAARPLGGEVPHPLGDEVPHPLVDADEAAELVELVAQGPGPGGGAPGVGTCLGHHGSGGVQGT